MATPPRRRSASLPLPNAPRKLRDGPHLGISGARGAFESSNVSAAIAEEHAPEHQEEIPERVEPVVQNTVSLTDVADTDNKENEDPLPLDEKPVDVQKGEGILERSILAELETSDESSDDEQESGEAANSENGDVLNSSDDAELALINSALQEVAANPDVDQHYVTGESSTGSAYEQYFSMRKRHGDSSSDVAEKKPKLDE